LKEYQDLKQFCSVLLIKKIHELIKDLSDVVDSNKDTGDIIMNCLANLSAYFIDYISKEGQKHLMLDEYIAHLKLFRKEFEENKKGDILQ